MVAPAPEEKEAHARGRAGEAGRLRALEAGGKGADAIEQGMTDGDGELMTLSLGGKGLSGDEAVADDSSAAAQPQVKSEQADIGKTAKAVEKNAADFGKARMVIRRAIKKGEQATDKTHEILVDRLGNWEQLLDASSDWCEERLDMTFGWLFADLKGIKEVANKDVKKINSLLSIVKALGY